MININKKYTALYNKHLSIGAKIVSFAGYEMPVSYKGSIKNEYLAIREKVGMFDVSHMGEISILGNDAENFLQFMTTNDIFSMQDGDAQYNLICNNKGGIKDDIIVLKIHSKKFLLVVNASNCDKIYDWFIDNNKFSVDIENVSSSYSLIAVQGPESRKILNDIFNVDINLKFYKHQNINFENQSILISRTGYTGELGYEIFCDNNLVLNLWDILFKKNVIPCGLAVRDVLRMEMKYCLYGNDIHEDIKPYEAGLSWVVKKNKNDFIGKEQILLDDIKKKLIAFEMIDKAIPRKGYDICCENNKLGKVTSGTFSIGLQKGIGLGYIRGDYTNKQIYINIRNKNFRANIIVPPFINNYSLKN